MLLLRYRNKAHALRTWEQYHACANTGAAVLPPALGYPWHTVVITTADLDFRRRLEAQLGTLPHATVIPEPADSLPPMIPLPPAVAAAYNPPTRRTDSFHRHRYRKGNGKHWL